MFLSLFSFFFPVSSTPNLGLALIETLRPRVACSTEHLKLGTSSIKCFLTPNSIFLLMKDTGSRSIYFTIILSKNSKFLSHTSGAAQFPQTLLSARGHVTPPQGPPLTVQQSRTPEALRHTAVSFLFIAQFYSTKSLDLFSLVTEPNVIIEPAF